MNAEEERQLRKWLEARDPGDAPASLRAFAAEVPYATRPSLLSPLDGALARLFGPFAIVRPVLLLIVLLTLLLAGIGAALVLRSQPFSPPGLITYKSIDGLGGIGVIASDGSGNRDLTLGEHDKSPRWSPDGRRLLFIRFVDGPLGSTCTEQTSIVIHDVELGSERVLTTVPIVVKAEWSPSGAEIAFFGFGQGCEFAGMGLIDVASGRVTTSDAGTGAFYFFWTGDRITFGYPDHLSRFDPASSGGQAAEERLFTFDVGQQALPSPSGRYVVLSTNPDFDRNGGLEIVDLTDGSRVDIGPGSFGWWSPDGSSVAFIQPGVPHTLSNVWRDRLVVTEGVERRLRTIADVVEGTDSITNLSWTSDGRAIYWNNAFGARAVEVSTGRSMDLPRILIASRDLQWQPQP